MTLPEIGSTPGRDSVKPPTCSTAALIGERRVPFQLASTLVAESRIPPGISSFLI
jgi:hypothetical protein